MRSDEAAATLWALDSHKLSSTVRLPRPRISAIQSAEART